MLYSEPEKGDSNYSDAFQISVVNALAIVVMFIFVTFFLVLLYKLRCTAVGFLTYLT